MLRRRNTYLQRALSEEEMRVWLKLHNTGIAFDVCWHGMANGWWLRRRRPHRPRRSRRCHGKVYEKLMQCGFAYTDIYLTWIKESPTSHSPLRRRCENEKAKNPKRMKWSRNLRIMCCMCVCVCAVWLCSYTIDNCPVSDNECSTSSSHFHPFGWQLSGTFAHELSHRMNALCLFAL